MKKAVVFDLDGTLIHSLPDIAAAMNKALAAQGLPAHPEEAYRAFTGDGVINLTRRALGEYQQHFEAVYDAYRLEYGRNSRVLSAPYAGIPSMLDRLHAAGLLLCVLSNKDDDDTREVLAHYFPRAQFAAIRGRREDVPLKPDPTALLQMVAQVGLRPEDCWYVGDTVTDMRCGKNAGMERIAVLWGFQPEEALAAEQPEHFARTPGELEALLMA